MVRRTSRCFGNNEHFFAWSNQDGRLFEKERSNHYKEEKATTRLNYFYSEEEAKAMAGLNFFICTFVLITKILS